MRVLTTTLTGLVFSISMADVSVAQDVSAARNPGELKKALGDIPSDGWIYEDIEAGYRAARTTGKPLLVSFR